MTRDQEIYNQIATTLYQLPCEKSLQLRVIIELMKDSLSPTFHMYYPSTSEIRPELSDDALSTLSSLIIELRAFYEAEALGYWNVAHCLYDPSKPQISFEFEEVIDIDNGKLPFWKYVKNYKNG